jgi:pimeloyl-ACP methyl ester carboxylesterase
MITTRMLWTKPPGRPQIRLAILEKRHQHVDDRRPPVLLVHGATLGHRLFDLPRPGYSLMDELARSGRTVYALDIRGYGSSVSGSVMDEEPARNPPFAGVDAAVEDVTAAVRLILEHRGAAALDLIGFSWGAVVAGRFAGAQPAQVARLVLYAPFFASANLSSMNRISDPSHRERLAPGFGAYRLITFADLVRRWDDELSGGEPALYRDDAIPGLIFESLAALDPLAQSRWPPSFRCPNGALEDLLRIRTGRQLYDPGRLTMPTLILRGAEDITSMDADATCLLERIASPIKDYRAISPGSHFLCVEKNRARLYEQLDGFLRPVSRNLQTSG